MNKKRFSKFHSLFSSPAENQKLFYWFHKGLGLIYLIALFPLFFQINVLIGKDGLQPASTLLQLAYHQEGYFKSFLQFPSLFHFMANDFGLYFIISLGCIGSIMLIFSRKIFVGALLAWISFLSITTIGGDFFVIIIDLFLAEIGFLALFSTYYEQKYNQVPKIIDFAFRLLNFRLWFCMGIVKFYLPIDVWTNFTFFDYFFHAQPMPSPAAPYLNNATSFLKIIAHCLLFLVEIIIPFFVFGKKRWRIVSFILFVGISIMIQIGGNYGYFNVLSILLALLILKDSDLTFIKTAIPLTSENIAIQKHLLPKVLISYQMGLQLIYCIYVFNPNPHSPQNQFNYIFTNINTENKLFNTIIKPFEIAEYWRTCNPYGVFKGIPYHHAEIRLSGSYDGVSWQVYQFKYLPSGNTDYLGFYAPYYPRLDHLFFYETIAAQNYKWNPLNKFYSYKNPWIATFINKLLANDKTQNQLLKLNPFENNPAPKYIKAELFQLSFSKNSERHWDEKSMNLIKIYSKEKPCTSAIISFEEAMNAVYSKN